MGGDGAVEPVGNPVHLVQPVRYFHEVGFEHGRPAACRLPCFHIHNHFGGLRVQFVAPVFQVFGLSCELLQGSHPVQGIEFGLSLFLGGLGELELVCRVAVHAVHDRERLVDDLQVDQAVDVSGGFARRRGN